MKDLDQSLLSKDIRILKQSNDEPLPTDPPNQLDKLKRFDQAAFYAHGGPTDGRNFGEGGNNMPLYTILPSDWKSSRGPKLGCPICEMAYNWAYKMAPWPDAYYPKYLTIKKEVEDEWTRIFDKTNAGMTTVGNQVKATKQKYSAFARGVH